MFRIFALLILITSLTHLSLASEISNSVEPVKYFSGRNSELENLTRNLIDYKKASIVGISGIGKTQLIRKFVQSNNYKLVWFFDCNRDFDAQYLSLAKHVNQNIKDKNLAINENYANVKQAIFDYLKPKKNWLLIYDNLKLGQNHLIKEIVELEANGDIIIASQDGSNLPYAVYLHPLSQNESLEIINKIIPGNDNAEYLDKIFKGYPLLISQGLMLVKNNSVYLSADYPAALSKKASSIKLYMELLLKNINPSTKDLLYKIAVINNQNFSKQFLEQIVTYKNEFDKELNYLIQLGLISKVHDSADDQIFEMHEAIKEQILSLICSAVIKNTVSDVIIRINKMMPKLSSDRYLIFTNNQTIIPSFEKLLANAELYKIRKNKILNLREKLVSFYISQRDFIKCAEMAKWLLKYEKNNPQLWLMSEEDKAVYASYLDYISTYKEWSDGDLVTTINLKNKVKNILLDINGYYEYKFSLFVQLAQSYITIRNIDEANKNLFLAQKYVQNDLNKKIINFIRARINLSQGRFKEALDIINSIKGPNNEPLVLNSMTAAVFLTKAKTLNLLNRPQEALNVLNRLRIFENNKEQYSDVMLFTSVELAQSFLILEKIDLAYIYITKAKNLLSNYHKNDCNILVSQNYHLSPILKVEADCLSAMGDYSQALINYAQAEAISYDIYRKNMKNNPMISSLYFNAASTACKAKDKFWFNKFKFQHLAKFGLDHPKSQEIQNMHCF